MTDISKEAHEALVKSAVDEATRVTEAALAAKTTEAAAATTKAAEAEKAAADLKAGNDDLNKKLDDAQVKLKAAEDEAKAAKDELAKSKTDAEKADIAGKRAEQVKGLAIFGDDYVTEKASAWAELDEAAWTDKVAEWQRVKGTTSTEEKPGDTASAMTGTSKTGLTTEVKQDDAAAGGAETTKKPSPRRTALGLLAKP